MKLIEQTIHNKHNKDTMKRILSIRVSVMQNSTTDVM
jgi:hypothetical protein